MAPRKTTTKKRKTAPSQKTIRDYKPINHEKIRKPKKYKQRKVPGTDKAIDRALPAKPVGWRVSDSGKVYFENRENRSDTDKERRYHGGVNRRAKPGKRTAKPSTRTTRSTTTARRVSQVGKLDEQKPRRITVTVIPQKPGTVTPKTKKFQFFEPVNTKKLSQAELEKIVTREMLKIHCEEIEHSIVIDRCGNVLCHGIGGKRSVAFFEAAYQSMYGASFIEKYGNDIIHIHNHPGAGWEGAPTPFSGADLKNQRTHFIIDRRVCCRGHAYRAVIEDADKFKRTIQPKRLESYGDKAFKRAAEMATEKIPYPRQTESDTATDYARKVRKWHKDFYFLTAELTNAIYQKELKDFGLKYSHRIFTKKGLVKND